MTSFTVHVQLRIPDEIVRYVPGFWEMIKYAWVQYISVVLIIYFVILQLQDFLFSNGVLQTTVTHAQTTSRKPKF